MKRPSPRTPFVLVALVLGAGLTFSLIATGGATKEQARLTAASGAYTAFEARLKAGSGTAESVYVWSVRWHDSEKKNRTALLAAQSHLTRMRSLQTTVKANVAAGTMSSADEKGAAYYVAEAEVWVADAGGVP